MTDIHITPEHAKSIKAANFGVKIQSILKSLSEFPKSTIVLTCCLFFTLHLWIALLLEDFVWVSSFGALLSIISLLLIASESLFSGLDCDIKNIYPNENPNEIDTFGLDGFCSAIESHDVESELEKRRKLFNVKYKNISLYLGMSIVGTLTWAYVGFLNKVFY